jgi:hypothetical protein
MRHAVSTLLFAKTRAEPHPFSVPRGDGAPGGARGFARPSCGAACEAAPHAGAKQVCETCSEARAPDRIGFARPAAAALRHPARHRTGDRPARLSRGALSAPRSSCRPRRVMTAPDRVERESWEYMLPAIRRQDRIPAHRRLRSPAPAGTQLYLLQCWAKPGSPPQRSERTMFFERLYAGTNEACCYYVLCHPGRMLYSSAHAIHAPSG